MGLRIKTLSFVRALGLIMILILPLSLLRMANISPWENTHLHTKPKWNKFDSSFFPAMSLSEHRQAIDKLDAQIVRLLNERTRHVLAIGEIKLKAGEEIYAPHRDRKS